MANADQMNHIMTRVFGREFDAMRAAEAGMLADAALVTIVPINSQNLEFGRTRVYWRVLDDAHIRRVDKAISKELYPDEEGEDEE